MAHRGIPLNAEYKYRAFISYSHQDKTWGDWLHKGLESYRVPKPLIGRETRFGPVPARLFPIFRDREELPTTSDLSHAIDDALRDSLMLIVMCSPASAASQWVNEEIRAFKHLHGEDRILAIVIGGEPNATDKGAPTDECFPEALRYKVGPDGALTDERTEPIAADARPHGDGKDDALLKLLSGVLAVNFNDLKQREVQAARRRARIAQSIAGVMAVLALVAVGAGWVAYQNQQIAEEQRAEAVAQRQIAEAQTRRADAERDIAEAQRRLAESRLREALIERTSRIIADGHAAARTGAAEQAMTLALAALETARDLQEPPLTDAAAQLAQALLIDDRTEALLYGRYPEELGTPAFGAASVSPDGDTIMARRGDRLLLWRRLTGERLQRVTGVAASAYRASGKIVGLLEGGQVFVLAPQTGAGTVVGGGPASVRHAVINKGGDQVAYVDGHDLVVLDLATGQNRRVLAVDASEISGLFWAPDGQHLGAVAFDPARARFWRIDDGTTVADISLPVSANRILFDSGTAALVDSDDHWRRVDLSSGEVSHLNHGERIDDALFATAGTIILEQALGPALTVNTIGDTRPLGDAPTYGLVGLHADGREVLLRGARQFILHDVVSGAKIRDLGRPAGAPPAAFHLSASGAYLAVLDDDDLITVWSVGDGRETLALRLTTTPARIWMLDAPMGAVLMVLDTKGHLSVHRAEAARLTHSGIIGLTEPLENGLVPLSVGYPEPTRLWDIATRHAVRELPGPAMAQDRATGRILTRDGADLVIVQLATEIQRPSPSPVPARLQGNVPRIVSATFGPKDRLAIQTPEGVLLFDTDTGTQLGAWQVPIDQMRADRSVAFSPDGARMLVLTGHDGLADIDTETAATVRTLVLPHRADQVTIGPTSNTAIIQASAPHGGVRYDLTTGSIAPVQAGGELLAVGPHVALVGDGPALTVIDRNSGLPRFTQDSRGEAYAAGHVDRVILSHLTGTFATSESDHLTAQDAANGTSLWRIPTRRPLGTHLRPPVLSQTEEWALVSDIGPNAGYLVDVNAGRVAATLPLSARSTLTLSGDNEFSVVAAQDGLRTDVFDFSPLHATPAQLTAMLRARIQTIRGESESITECDRVAAHPDDPLAITTGRAVEDIPLDAAALCQQALASIGTGPAAARLTYQMSRALDAMGQSQEAIRMLERLAARDYPMAHHALGIWRLGGVGGGPEDAAAHFLKAADGGVGASWVVLARMADAGMVDGDRDSYLQQGANAGAADALEALALENARAGDLSGAFRLARKAALAAAPHRRYRFEALTATLARRLWPDAWALEGDME